MLQVYATRKTDKLCNFNSSVQQFVLTSFQY